VRLALEAVRKLRLHLMMFEGRGGRLRQERSLLSRSCSGAASGEVTASSPGLSLRAFAVSACSRRIMCATLSPADFWARLEPGRRHLLLF
jgi:hypothetical protein